MNPRECRKAKDTHGWSPSIPMGSVATCRVKHIKSVSPGETLEQNCVRKTSLRHFTSSKRRWNGLCVKLIASTEFTHRVNLQIFTLGKALNITSCQCLGLFLSGPTRSWCRSKEGPTQGVQRGTWMDERDHNGTGRKMREREKACMVVDKNRSRNPNCLLGRLLFFCTGRTARFFM